jgi:hypothetical protein
MMGQEIQGVVPLVQTKAEKTRIIRVKPGVYNTVRSFVESSLKDEYPWRVALEFPEYYVWRKEGKWELEVYKNSRPITDFKELPVRGIYKIDTTNNISPFATLKSLRTADEVWFVLIGGDVGVLYAGRAMLAFTSYAPVAFAPIVPVPFSRLIPVYEVLDVLNHYVSL